MTVSNIIKQTSLVVSAGVLLTACASTHKEDTEYSSSYSSKPALSESSGAQNYSSSQSSTSSSDQNEVVIPLHEEQFNVGKKTVPSGQVTIRKIVTTETVSQPVQLRHERVVIEREGAGAQSGQASSSSNRSSSQSVASAEANASAPSASTQAGVSASGQAPSASISTSQEPQTAHRKDATVGAQLNQRAFDANKTVLGAEPVGAKPDYNAITGVRRADSAADAAVSEPTNLPERSYSATTGAPISEAAGAEANYSSGRSSSTTTSGTQSQSSQSQSAQSAPANAFQEQTYTIQLNEEQPVIEKNVRETGRVVARKNASWQQQNVQQQIRREDVQIDKGENAENVELKGNFNESAGAQRSQQGSYNAQPSSSTSSEFNQPATSSYERKTSVRHTRSHKRLNTDNNTLDDINRGSNTRGGAEDLTDFDEKANSSRGVIEPSGAQIKTEESDKGVEVKTNLP